MKPPAPVTSARFSVFFVKKAPPAFISRRFASGR